MMDLNDNLKKYKGDKDRLLELLNRGEYLFNKLDLTNEAKSIERLTEKLRAETFKVMVVGSFKVGKSTLINAILGSDILPAYAIPTTGVINEIKYGEEKRAFLHFKGNITKELPATLSPVARQHINKYRPNVPPMEIPVNYLEEFVVIPDPDKRQEDSISETPYSKVELFWPVQLFEKQVEFIDSPGLNENENRTVITLDYLPKADVILFVVSALSPLSMREREYIDNHILKTGQQCVFFIINRFDQVPARDRQRFKSYICDALAGKTNDNRYILFVDSAGALTARTADDIESLTTTGFPEMEDLLMDFLVNKKGRIKLLQPVQELTVRISHAVTSSIPNEIAVLQSNMEEIQERLNAAQPELAALKDRQVFIAERTERQINYLELEIEAVFKDNIYSIIENTPDWINHFSTQRFSPLKPKESAAKILEEIIEQYQQKIESEQNLWFERTLSPLITNHLEGIKQEFEEQVFQFLVRIEDITFKISSKIDIDGTYAGRDISTVERVSAGMVGVILGDVGSGLMGASYGFGNQFFKQLILQTGSVITLLLLGLTNPFSMIPVVSAIALYGFADGAAGVERKLKAEASKKIQKELQEKLNEIAREQAHKIKIKLLEVVSSVIIRLQDSTNSLQSRIEKDLLNRKDMEGHYTQEKIWTLKNTLNELSDLDRKLAEFTAGLSNS